MCPDLRHHDLAHADVAVVCPGQLRLHPAQCLQPALELGDEGLHRIAGAQSLLGNGLDHCQQVARSVLNLRKKNLLTGLHPTHVVDVGHRADPIAVESRSVLDWTSSRLMPSIVVGGLSKDAMLSVILSLRPSIGPCGFCRIAIFGMDCVQPTTAKAFIETQSSKLNPLRTWPRTAAIRTSKE